MVHHRDNQGEFEDTAPSRVTLISIASIRHRLSIRMTIGVLCFVLSLLFYYGSVLRVQLKRTGLLDLGPYTDAVEYFAQADSISKGMAPAIQIGYDRLPSRYPPGYPVLMLPWLKLLPHNEVLAPFRTNETIGLLLLIGGFVFYSGIGRPLAGGLVSLLLATQPAFISFARSSMSDLSGATAAVLAFVLVYIGLRRGRRWPIYLAAIVLGLSLCIRSQLLFFAPLLIAMALFPTDGSWPRWLMHCCLVVIVFAVASLPYFLFNSFEFGNPLKTGYHFWVPDWAESTRLFSVHNVPAQLAMLWSEITANWNEFRVANLFGTGTYIVPAFVLLAVLGLAFVRIDRFTVAAFLGGISYFVATLTYAFVDGRFYFPLFVVLVGLAVLPADWAVSRVLELRFSISTVAVLLIFLLSVIGYPSQSGFKPTGNRSQAWDALNYANSKQRSRKYEAQKEFAGSFRDAPGIVLSDIDSAYLNVLLPKPFIAAPIDNDHFYRFSRLWHYGKSEAIQLVQNALNDAMPVYALLFPSKNAARDIQRLPLIQGYSWKRSEQPGLWAVTMILTKDPADSTP